MAVNLFNEYPQNTKAPSEDYPFGAFRNRTAPTATDGTTLEEKWSNDWQAFFSRLFIEASMTPSGEVDTVKVSQYYDALLAIIQREKVEVSNSLNGTRTDVAASEDALRRTHELASSKVSKSGDTMTGDLMIQNMLSKIILSNPSIPHNNVGHNVFLWNNAGNPTVTTTNSNWSGASFNQTFPRKSGTIALTSDIPQVGIGVGQNWVDVTGSRSSGVTYTNNTGRPIQVTITTSATGASLELLVGGVLVAETGSATTTVTLSLTAIIPTGMTYVAIGTVRRWAELR